MLYYSSIPLLKEEKMGKSKSDVSAYNQSYYKKNREVIRARAKKHYEENKEDILRREREKRWEDIESYREYQKKRRRKNPLHSILQRKKAYALKKGIEFNLKPKDIIVPEFCPILGIRLAGPLEEPKENEDKYNIDRIDPNKGYTPDNVWVISRKANLIKTNATPEEIFKVGLYLLNKQKEER